MVLERKFDGVGCEAHLWDLADGGYGQLASWKSFSVAYLRRAQADCCRRKRPFFLIGKLILNKVERGFGVLG
ncbi:MAG: hypothetical protein ACKO96_20575, partial [Flammeovirgaceae bacterium]